MVARDNGIAFYFPADVIANRRIYAACTNTKVLLIAFNYLGTNAPPNVVGKKHDLLRAPYYTIRNYLFYPLHDRDTPDAIGIHALLADYL